MCVCVSLKWPWNRVIKLVSCVSCGRGRTDKLEKNYIEKTLSELRMLALSSGTFVAAT